MDQKVVINKQTSFVRLQNWKVERSVIHSPGATSKFDNACSLSTDMLRADVIHRDESLGEPVLCVAFAQNYILASGNNRGGLTLSDCRFSSFHVECCRHSVFADVGLASLCWLASDASDTSSRIACGSYHGFVRVIDVERGACLFAPHKTHVGVVRSVQGHNGESQSVLLSAGGISVCLHDTRTPVSSSRTHTILAIPHTRHHNMTRQDKVTAAVWVGGHSSPYIASGGTDGCVRVWDIRKTKGMPVVSLSNMQDGVQLLLTPTRGQAGRTVTGLVCHELTGSLWIGDPDSVSCVPLPWLLAGAGPPGKPSEGEGDMAENPHGQGQRTRGAYDVTPDDVPLSSSSFSSLKSQACVSRNTLHGPLHASSWDGSGAGRAMAVSQCGTMVARDTLINGRGAIVLWTVASNLQNGSGPAICHTPSHIMQGHSSVINGVAFAGGCREGDSGVRMATACDDGLVRLWAPFSPALAFRSLQHPGYRDGDAGCDPATWTVSQVYGSGANCAYTYTVPGKSSSRNAGAGSSELDRATDDVDDVLTLNPLALATPDFHTVPTAFLTTVAHADNDSDEEGDDANRLLRTAASGLETGPKARRLILEGGAELAPWLPQVEHFVRAGEEESAPRKCPRIHWAIPWDAWAAAHPEHYFVFNHCAAGEQECQSGRVQGGMGARDGPITHRQATLPFARTSSPALYAPGGGLLSPLARTVYKECTASQSTLLQLWGVQAGGQHAGSFSVEDIARRPQKKRKRST